MPFDSTCELLADASALACLVADTRQRPDARDRGLQQLRPVIESIARRVSAGFRGNWHHDLVAESCAIIWLQLPRFDPARGRFEDWCRVVLYRYALDVWRKSRRGPVRPAVGGDEVHAMLEAIADDDARDASEDALARCREARRVLDRIAWPPPRAVDYFAVLLLQLRVAAARYLTQGALSQDAAWRADLPLHVEWLLPWHPAEQQRPLKRDWPPLATCWESVRAALATPAARIDADALCRTIAACLPPAAQLTPDVWNQWVHRAKDQARTRVQDEAVWARCFARLLPDYQRGASS